MDDITACKEGRNKDLAGMAERVLKSTKRVEEKGLVLSVTERGKEGKSNVIASCTYLAEKFGECNRREGVELTTSVETLGVDLRTTKNLLGAKREGEKEEVRREVLTCQKKSRLSESFRKTW